MPASCPMCDRVARAGEDPLFVAGLEAGSPFLFGRQFYRGCTLFMPRRRTAELSELPAWERAAFLEGMVRVAAAVHAEFRLRKINYEPLGNVVLHLHRHILQRHRDDPQPRSPVWELDTRVCEAPGTAPTPEGARTLNRRSAAG